jgi:hypothetical protein
MRELPSPAPSAADLSWRFCFDLVDGSREHAIEHADLLLVGAVNLGEKISQPSQHIDAFAGRTTAHDVAWIVK